MNKYADYGFYINEFGGKTIKADDFDSAVLKASTFLDKITFGRIKEPTDDIRFAACAIAERIVTLSQALNESKGGAVSSEKNGDVSVTYNVNIQSAYSSEAYREYYSIAAALIRDKRLLERWCVY